MPRAMPWGRSIIRLPLPTGESEDQQRAIYHVLRASDRITGLRGLAGTGKTTVLHELVAAWKDSQAVVLRADGGGNGRSPQGRF